MGGRCAAGDIIALLPIMLQFVRHNAANDVAGAKARFGILGEGGKTLGGAAQLTQGRAAIEQRPGMARRQRERPVKAAERFVNTPEAFQRHIANIAGPYHRILIRARDRGELDAFSDLELEVVVHMLMGARSYLGQRFGPAQPPDGAVMRAYARLLAGGLFGERPREPAD